MSAVTLEHVKNLIGQLTPKEQKELMEYLQPHVNPPGNGGECEQATAPEKVTLQDLWLMSDELAAREDPNSETMTQEFLRTRR